MRLVKTGGPRLKLLLCLVTMVLSSCQHVQASDITVCPNTSLGATNFAVPKRGGLIKGPRHINLYNAQRKDTQWSIEIDTEGKSTLLFQKKSIDGPIKTIDFERAFGKVRKGWQKLEYVIAIADNQMPLYFYLTQKDGNLQTFRVALEGDSSGWSTVEKER